MALFGGFHGNFKAVGPSYLRTFYLEDEQGKMCKRKDHFIHLPHFISVLLAHLTNGPFRTDARLCPSPSHSYAHGRRPLGRRTKLTPLFSGG